MNQINLFEGEEILITSGDKTITLTNKRIRQCTSSYNKEHITSMHLEKISTIEIHYKSQPALLIFGIILAIAGGAFGALTNIASILVVGVVLSLLFVVLYFISKHYAITFASDGGAKINILAKGMKREIIMDFVNKIEQAKSLIK
jgi:hypothetical protein